MPKRGYMPRFYVEPRPYCLIRAQKQNPFFLVRAAAISLCKFRRRCFFFSPRLPASPPLETTTRASCHHRRLVSHPATAVSSRLQPPPRELLRRLVWRPSTTTRDHCCCLVPLSGLRSASELMEDGRATAAGPCAWKEDGVVNRSGAVSLAEMKKWWICLRGGCTAKKMEAVRMEDASL
ncbi:hypothetical protein DEO72_LG1g2004 [Vigna unguiculata]|uniref:Uncharacterized protein n=1 Tax=Vigna unguiculata TaxID=3917 RepID=A0A4D6KLK4_VIGUN|nr:hypothetical protein DEO72_LG1g2004 [Vigna unguiculata]